MRIHAKGLLLCIVGAGTLLAACGGSSSGGKTATTASSCPIRLVDAQSSPVEIKFWQAETAANEETLLKLVDQFNASQTKIKVTATFQGSYDESTSKYLAALRGGDLPDIVQVVDWETQRVIDSASTVKVQDCIDAEKYDMSDYLPRVAAYWKVGGQLSSYPFAAATNVLYYNALAFEKAGLDPAKPPVTLDDVRAYSKKIVDSGASRHGIALEMHSWWVENLLAKAGQVLVNNGNGRDARATEAAFDSDAGRSIFSWIKSMIDDGLAMNVGRNPSGADALLAIGSGDAAMALGSSAGMRSVFGVLESGQFPNVKIGVSAMPGIPGDGGVLVGGASLFIVSKSPPVKQEAARIFARWLDEPAQQAAWHVGSGYIPIRRSAAASKGVQDLWTTSPQFKVAYDDLAQDRVTAASAGAVVGPFLDVRNAVVGGLEAMVLQGTDPATALRDAASKASDAIRSYNQRIGQ
jgi:sn-glycerol 3-phosphate transport system substrate-binding protein